MDLSPVGRLAAELLELIDKQYPEGTQVELRAALVAVDIGVVDDEGEHWTNVRFQFGCAPDWDNDTSSTAYGAGVAAKVFSAFTEGERIDPD
jgi:hypothetical protein